MFFNYSEDKVNSGFEATTRPAGFDICKGDNSSYNVFFKTNILCGNKDFWKEKGDLLLAPTLGFGSQESIFSAGKKRTLEENLHVALKWTGK